MPLAIRLHHLVAHAGVLGRLDPFCDFDFKTKFIQKIWPRSPTLALLTRQIEPEVNERRQASFSSQLTKQHSIVCQTLPCD